MKLSIAGLSLFAAAATADFILYTATEASWEMQHGGWKIFDNEPDCNDFMGAILYLGSSDVTARGDVRCSGDGCWGGNDTPIDELEMRFSRDPLIHLTMYRDRDMGLYGVDGEKYGECEESMGHTVECGAGLVQTGARKLFCTYYRSAQEIQDLRSN